MDWIIMKTVAFQDLEDHIVNGVEIHTKECICARSDIVSFVFQEESLFVHSLLSLDPAVVLISTIILYVCNRWLFCWSDTFV